MCHKTVFLTEYSIFSDYYEFSENREDTKIGWCDHLTWSELCIYRNISQGKGWENAILCGQLVAWFVCLAGGQQVSSSSSIMCGHKHRSDISLCEWSKSSTRNEQKISKYGNFSLFVCLSVCLCLSCVN